MSTKTYIKVNGTALPFPTDFQVSANDLDSENSTRSEGTGILTRERIRANVHEVSYAVDMITDAQLETIQRAIEPEAVQIELWWGKTINAKMYASKPSASIMAHDPVTGTTYWSFSVSFTEY